MMCLRAMESTGLGTCLDRCSASGAVGKSERTAQTENSPLPALYTARDQKLMEILTGAAPDCRPQPGKTFLALVWFVTAVKRSGKGGWQGGAAARLLMKKHQNIII
jgi:hypothetical protein